MVNYLSIAFFSFNIVCTLCLLVSNNLAISVNVNPALCNLYTSFFIIRTSVDFIIFDFYI